MSFSNLQKKPENSTTKNNEIKRTPKIKVDKEALKQELRILILCSRAGHKTYLKYPDYNIKTAEQLNARINQLIELISK